MPDTAIRSLWSYATNHRSRFRLGIAVTVANKFFDVLPELLIGIAVDTVVRGRASLVSTWTGVDDRWSQLLVVAAATVLIWVCESLTDYWAALIWRNLAQSIEHDARSDLYRHLQRLELAFFEDRTSGGLLSVVSDDVNQLERFLDVGARDVIATFTNVIFVGVFFLVVSPILALVAFVPIPLIVAASLWYQRRLEPRYTAVREAVGELSGALTNNLGGIATIRAFVAEDREADRIDELSNRYRLANREAIRLSSAFVPLIRMAILAAFVVTLVVGGRATLDGSLQVGLFSSLVYMTQRLLWPLTRMGETFDLYQRAAASVRRIFGLLAMRPAIVEGREELAVPTPGAVRFAGVHFEYDAEHPVLRGVDLAIPSGATHAIVGATGAGKSTILKLLLRLYEPTGGTITIDGVDISGLSFVSLRGAIGYVSQDTFLFEGTVAENLAYGRPDATHAELSASAELAEAAEFIDRLPQGYETPVGERGQKLSGGQRQRLSIARALVRDPAILVLDEATSAVDNETEAAIQRSLARVSVGRTTIVIAHRLSTVRHADRIHVLERGEVVESGTHEELCAAGGLYAALWRVQTGESGGAVEPGSTRADLTGPGK